MPQKISLFLAAEHHDRCKGTRRGARASGWLVTPAFTYKFWLCPMELYAPSERAPAGCRIRSFLLPRSISLSRSSLLFPYLKNSENATWTLCSKLSLKERLKVMICKESLRACHLRRIENLHVSKKAYIKAKQANSDIMKILRSCKTRKNFGISIALLSHSRSPSSRVLNAFES